MPTAEPVVSTEESDASWASNTFSNLTTDELRRRSPRYHAEMVRANSLLERHDPQKTSHLPESRGTSASVPARVPARVRILQKWEGEVIDVGAETFSARLQDLVSSNPLETVELSLEELSPDDRPLLAPGSVFLWCIGYRDSVGGRRNRFSEITIRRLPPFSEQEFERARARSERLESRIRW